MSKQFKKLCEPITINGMELRNRTALAPMSVGYTEGDDLITQRLIDYYARRAEGHTGLIISGVAPVDQGGKSIAFMNSIWDDSFIPGWKKLADAIHAAGSKLAAQIMFGGLEGFPIMSKGQQLSPDGGIWKLIEELFPMHPDLNKSMFLTRKITVEELKALVQKFADAAVRAQKAGVDAVEIQGSQGFLLQQMMSSHFNHRTDEYGGSVENRMRFTVEVIEKVREAVGKDYPVLFRMVASEGLEDGITVEEAKKMAQMAVKAGADAIHVTTGRGITGEGMNAMIPIAEIGPAPVANQIAEIKKVIDVPVIGVQSIRTPEVAEELIASGKMDMVALGRGLIADPDWALKAEEGRSEDIRQCIGCNQGCIDNLLTAFFVDCLQNPEVGRERKYKLEPVDNPKNILVIGGGIAGLETAVTAAKRGHKVTLCEKDNVFGGQWNLAATPPGKDQFNAVVNWRVHELEKMDNVTLKLNTTVTPEYVKTLDPDIAVVATGSVPITPPIPGADKDNVFNVPDTLTDKADIGKNVAVIGGGACGVETAHYLLDKGKKVTIVEMLPEIARDEKFARKVFILESLAKKGANVAVSSPVKKITEGNELIVSKNGKNESLGKFDTFVMALGVKSENSITKYLEGMVPAVYEVGDAYPNAANGFSAIQHAALIGRML
ncbi:MAG: NAD(P)/FAD-dependent oxidoreductase [Desulfobacterales bacterium]|nr:NAD(P)/FAD-dependent oxidoreductase [Desulfobacterales bacterium]MDD4073357.1 NAD(P)/FAD-dependent oxidoreductase [Desulfobacterales bacterium]MDD4394110.1 NAD(P)/FAD-dependent oxidoreductase [Desulfobacterales bacterium]